MENKVRHMCTHRHDHIHTRALARASNALIYELVPFMRFIKETSIINKIYCLFFQKVLKDKKQNNILIGEKIAISKDIPNIGALILKVLMTYKEDEIGLVI